MHMKDHQLHKIHDDELLAGAECLGWEEPDVLNTSPVLPLQTGFNTEFMQAQQP
jgi:hypothetical protein